MEELPELQELAKNYKDKGVAVIGLIGSEDKAAARSVLESMGVDYTNIVVSNDPEFLEYLGQFSYIPTTVFVNQKGEIARPFVVGGQSYEQLAETVKPLIGE